VLLVRDPRYIVLGVWISAEYQRLHQPFDLAGKSRVRLQLGRVREIEGCDVPRIERNAGDGEGRPGLVLDYEVLPISETQD